MKPIIYLFLVVYISSWSQVFIKQNFSDDIEVGMACVQGSGELLDTKLYRSFDWDTDIPFNGKANINFAYFALEEITENVEVTLTLYAAFDGFPNGTLEPRATNTFNATPADAFTIIAVPIEASFTPLSDDSIVYELSVPGNGTVFFGFGANAQGQSAPTYIQSEPCAINEPTDLETLGIFEAVVMYLEADGIFIGFEDETKTSFKVYPNPSNNILTILGEPQIENIRVHDSSGRLLIEQRVSSNHFILDTSALSAGEYIATILYEGKTEYSKFLKL